MCLYTHTHIYITPVPLIARSSYVEMLVIKLIVFIAIYLSTVTAQHLCMTLLVCLGLGIASLLIALLIRVLFTFVCVLCAGFNMKEKVFIALAWMPKATVQVSARIFLRVPFFCSKYLCLQMFFFLLVCTGQKYRYVAQISSFLSYRL